MSENASRRRRKDEIVLGDRTGQLPFTECIKNHRRRGNVPFSGPALRWPKAAPLVGTPADLQHSRLQVHVCPGQASELAAA